MFYDTLPTIYPVFGVAAPPTELLTSDGAFGNEESSLRSYLYSFDISASNDIKTLIILAKDFLSHYEFLTFRLVHVIEVVSGYETILDRVFSSIDVSFILSELAFSPYRETYLDDISVAKDKAGIWYQSFDCSIGSEILKEIKHHAFDSSFPIDTLVFVGKLLHGITDSASFIETIKLIRPVLDTSTGLEKSSMVKAVRDYALSVSFVSYRTILSSDILSATSIVKTFERTLHDYALYIDEPRIFVEDGILKIIAFTFDIDGYINVVFDNELNPPFILEAKVSPRSMSAKEATAGVIRSGYENTHPDIQKGSRVDVSGEDSRFVYDYIGDEYSFNNVLMDAVAEIRKWYIVKIAQDVSKTIFEIFDEKRETLDTKTISYGHSSPLKLILGESSNDEVNRRVESWFDWILKRRYIDPEPTVTFDIEQTAGG